MAILKANEPIPERPVVIGLYGEPGSSKTTLGNSANNVLVLDFDRGVSRSFNRQDTLIMNSWHDVIAEEDAGTFKNYKTVVIDTAKAALDDFLMSFVTERDIKLKYNKLGAYGAIGDEFKLFVSNRRNEGLDVIILAHATKEEDTKRIIPDITGQSRQLITRIADQLGYVNFVNNNRTIQWTPTDLTVGKNTANLPMITIPDKSKPELKHFMADVVAAVKKSLVQMSEAQREALAKSEEFQEKLNTCKTPDELTDFLTEVNALAAHLKIPLQKLTVAKAAELGFVPNKETKRYEKPAEEKQAEKKEDKKAESVKVSKKENEIIKTDLDTRCTVLQQLGMNLEGDRCTGGNMIVDYKELAEMSEDEFNELVDQVGTNIKKKATRKAVAATS